MGTWSTGLVAFGVSFGAVVLAEMGDKTQLLAMAFATRYKAGKVMLGVLLATVLNHALAVAVGSLLANVPGLDAWIQGIAALSFLFFGLWTLKGDTLEEGEARRRGRFGAVATVAIAFFIAELGDKTQLATIALAAKYAPTAIQGAFVLAGTTAGMLVADAVGIVVSVVLCRRIPERTVKVVSAVAFLAFGFVSGYGVLRDPDHLALSLGATLGILGVLAAACAAIGVALFRRSKPADVPEVDEYCAVRRPVEGDDPADAPAPRKAGEGSGTTEGGA